jgi:hypothetical protein
VKKFVFFGFRCLLGIVLLSSASALQLPADTSGGNDPAAPATSPAGSTGSAAQPAPADPPAQHIQAPPAAKPRAFESVGKVGIGVKISALGVGFEAAVPVTSNTNIRAGLNLFNYNRTLSQDGVSYVAKLNFRSSEAYFDWFPLHGSFHVSPGLLVYNGNRVTANALAPGGQTVTFNDIDYASDPNDPLVGNAQLDFNKLAPAFEVGWGNLVPRSHKHWSVPVEFGVIYQGAPRLDLNFSGSACDASGLNCAPVTSDSSFQSNLQAERDKLNHDLAPFKFYPVISVGFGYKF